MSAASAASSPTRTAARIRQRPPRSGDANPRDCSVRIPARAEWKRTDPPRDTVNLDGLAEITRGLHRHARLDRRRGSRVQPGLRPPRSAPRQGRGRGNPGSASATSERKSWAASNVLRGGECSGRYRVRAVRYGSVHADTRLATCSVRQRREHITSDDSGFSVGHVRLATTVSLRALRSSRIADAAGRLPAGRFGRLEA